MNFMYLDENDDKNKIKNLIDKYEFKDDTSNRYLDVSEILTTYNELKKISREHMKELDKLHKDNEKLLEYKNRIINNHTNHINILYNSVNDTDEDNIKELTQLIDKYEKTLTSLYNSWNDTYYNRKLMNLEKEIIETNEYLNIYQDFFKKIIKDFNENSDNQNKKICSICFENEVDMCAIPCGHTCCNTCVISNNINPSNRNKCLNCRNYINNYIKIFFSI